MTEVDFVVVAEVQVVLENHIAHTVSGPYTASPLATPTSLSVSAPGAFPITVGGGGTGRIGCSGCGAGPNVTAGGDGR